MDTFEIINQLGELKKKKKRYQLKSELQIIFKQLLAPTFRTSGIIPFFPSTKLHRYRTPRFAISCHHKIMSASPQADTYANTTVRLTANTSASHISVMIYPHSSKFKIPATIQLSQPKMKYTSLKLVNQDITQFTF